jgi:flagellar hook assembly protein FlgD
MSFSGAELVSVSAVDRDSRELKTSMTARVAPTTFALNPAYPNPFNPFTNLSFVLPEAMNYNLRIYNVAGQLVRSYEGVGSASLNVVTWDGRDNAGVEVSSGVYFYKLIAGGFSATEKMVMMK